LFFKKNLVILMLIIAFVFIRGLSCQTLKIEIKEVVSIGMQEAKEPGQEPYCLSHAGSPDIDGQGNIYILDGREDCVKKFDIKGKYIRTILAKGKGPKEISNPVRIGINPYSGTLFILHEYGFILKEVDTQGNFIKNHILPVQFFHYFQFLEKDKILFIAKDIYGKESYPLFKIVNLETGKLEKSFVNTSTEVVLNQKMRFVVMDGLIWFSGDNQVDIIAYYLEKGNLKHKIPFEIPLKKNFVKVIAKGKNYATLDAVFYNYSQPFLVEDKVFWLFTLNQFENEKAREKSFPKSTTQELYFLKEGKPVKIDLFNGFQGLDFVRARKNKLLFICDDPYPQIKVFELKLIK